MLGLNKKETKFFMGSLFGHAVLIGILGVLGFLPSCEEKEKEVHVFELTSASYALPSPPVVKPIDTPPLRKTPPPYPKTQIKPVVQPKPLPPKPKKIISKPTPKPKPRTIVSPQTVSFDQFKKKHKLPTPQTVPKTNNRAVSYTHLTLPTICSV